MMFYQKKFLHFYNDRVVKTETDKLINKYPDSNDLYKNLRREVVETHKIDGDDYYRRLIQPTRGNTKLLNEVIKKFKPKKSLGKSVVSRRLRYV